MSKKKNVFDFISMGLKSQNTIKKEQAEKRQKAINDATAFNKAFSDKTYTVAKKMMDNVEKVADYDFEAFFSRVNNQIAPHRKTQDDLRKERSKEFDDKIKHHKGKFNIEDYVGDQADYKNNIIEKTKKNIQKKKLEADERHSDELKDTSQASKNDSSHDHQFNFSIKESQANHEVEKEVIADLTSSRASVEPKTDLSIEALDEVNISLDTTVDEVDADLDGLIDQVDTDLDATIDQVDTDLDATIDQVDTDLDATIDQVDTDLDASLEDLDRDLNNLKNKYINKFINLKKISSKEETIDSNEKIRTQIGDDLNKDKNNEVTDQRQSFDETVKRKEIKKDVKDISSYSKDELNRNSKYYKKQKKDKFAKQMKVELDDNLIVKKQRSIRRLFKFSISFKLSFVFILLMILAVVSLSIAFYLGIDFVLELQTSGHMEDIQFFKDVLLIMLIIFNFVTILMGISISTRTSRQLVRPIDEMTQIVKQINMKEMDRRLNVKGMHDELKELAMTFNEMLDRIENSYETQNRFTSDASHELRTPIAVIQGYINMLDRWGKADGEILDESIEAIKSESHNMKRLTEKLLLLAKADKGILELEFQPFELDELVREISRETLMIDNSHTIQNEINDVQTIIADRESLKQAIRIFVDNAVKYTPDGGHISINSYINRKKIYIEIKDDGIGISKEDMDNIFNRFYRVDQSRTKDSGGHGLGLSIAKWIVSQHKGEIEVKSEVDKGTIITLILAPMTQ